MCQERKTKMWYAVNDEYFWDFYSLNIVSMKFTQTSALIRERKHSLQDYIQFNLKLNVKTEGLVLQTRKCSIIVLIGRAVWLCLEQVSIAANMALTFCGTLYFGCLWTKKVPKKKVLPQVLVPNTCFSFLDLGEIQHAAFRTAMYYQKDVITIIYLSWFWTRESWYEAGASKGLKNYWQ